MVQITEWKLRSVRTLFLLTLAGLGAFFSKPSLSWAPPNTTTGNDITITVLSGSASGLNLQDEGTYVATSSTLNCVGAGVTCTDQGAGILRITVPGGGAGGSGNSFELRVSSSEIRFGVPITSMVFVGSLSSAQFQNGVATITIQLVPGVISASHTNVNFWSSTRALASEWSVFITTSNSLTSSILTALSTNSIQNDAVGVDTTSIANTPATVAVYDEGTLQAGNVTSFNFTGAAVGATASGSTVTVNVTASGGGSDNLGSHVATRPVVMGNFGITQSTGIEVGVGLQLTTWMSTVSAYVSGPLTMWQQWPMSALTAAGTDFASVDSTNTTGGLLPSAWFRAFDGSTTEYARTTYRVPENIFVSSTIMFVAVVQPKTAAAGKNVQIIFQSTGTRDGQYFNVTNTTGMDICPMPSTQGEEMTCRWEQTVSGLGWSPGYSAYIQLGRGHDTSKLTSTELLGDLYIKSFSMGVPITGGGADNLGSHTAQAALNMNNFAIVNSTGIRSTKVAVGTTTSGLYSLNVTTSSEYLSFGISTNSHTTYFGPVPVLSGCGVSPTMAYGSNDARMVITPGATATGCVITFGIPYKFAPAVLVDQHTMSLVNALTHTETNEAITISQAGLGGNTLTVLVDGLRER